MKHQGHTIVRELKTKSDTLRIACSFTQNKDTSFVFTVSGIQVNLSEHFGLWKTFRDDRIDIKDMVETINNYFDGRI